MMAHELPQSILHKKNSHMTQPPQKNSNNPKTNKHKPVKNGERRLPNGAQVDFGNKSKKGSSSKKQPSLPDGSKPNFYNGNESNHSSSSSLSKQSLPNGEKPVFNAATATSNKKGKNPSLPNGEKPVFHDDSTTNNSRKNKSGKSNKDGKKQQQVINEDTYAGSSFHSSPAALNLPKPSFKTSPKNNNKSQIYENQSNVSSSGSSNGGSSNGGSPNQTLHSTPNLTTVHPPPPPPQYPVTMYPQPGYPGYPQPGFSYQVTPQGYINYQYPHGPAPPMHHPQMGYPMVNSHSYPGNFAGVHGFPSGVPPPPAAPAGQHAQANQFQQHQGQKITFNELLGSLNV